MFDPIGVFTKQFTPVDGGYLYYPSLKKGAKLVTAQEYAQLVESWRRVAGRSAILKFVRGALLTSLTWAVISTMMRLPEWSTWVATSACVMGVTTWILWASQAPRRLVKDRPAVTSPRDISDARKQARSLLNWPFVAFGLLFSGASLIGSVQSPKDSIASWGSLVVNGVMFVTFIWIAGQKARDR